MVVGTPLSTRTSTSSHLIVLLVVRQRRIGSKDVQNNKTKLVFLLVLWSAKQLSKCHACPIKVSV